MSGRAADHDGGSSDSSTVTARAEASAVTAAVSASELSDGRQQLPSIRL